MAEAPPADFAEAARGSDERLEVVTEVVADLPVEYQPTAMFALLLLWRLVEAVETIASRPTVEVGYGDSGADPKDEGPWMSDGSD